MLVISACRIRNSGCRNWLRSQNPETNRYKELPRPCGASKPHLRHQHARKVMVQPKHDPADSPIKLKRSQLDTCKPELCIHPRAQARNDSQTGYESFTGWETFSTDVGMSILVLLLLVDITIVDVCMIMVTIIITQSLYKGP